MKNSLQKIVTFAVKNYFITVFILIIAVLMAVAGFKILSTNQEYVYAEIKVGQGTWWATTQKPHSWFVDAIKQAGSEKDYRGKEITKIQSVQYYPYGGSSQFDVYIIAKLSVSKLGNTGKYSYKRSTLGVGAPIDFEFNNAQFSGTIIQLSEKPLHNKPYVEKTVTITKKNAYPWEFEAIPVGDKFHNGTTTVLEVLQKDSQDTVSLATDVYGNTAQSTGEPMKYVSVVLKLRGRAYNGQLVYGEELLIAPGKEVSLSTSNFVFNNYIVAAVE